MIFRLSNRFSLPSVVLFVLLSGCNEYNAVEEIGYDAPWYVTVVYDDGSRKSEMVESLTLIMKDESSPLPVKVEGVDRRTQETVYIDIEDVMKLNPGGMLVVQKYRTPIEPTSAESEKE